MSSFLSIVFAQTENPVFGPDLAGIAAPIEYLQRLFSSLIGLGLVAGGLIFFYVLISGALDWINAGGDKSKITNARNKLTNAFVGIVVLFAFFAAVDLAGCLFNTNFRSIYIGQYDIAFVGNPICPSGGGDGVTINPTPTPEIAGCISGQQCVANPETLCAGGVAPDCSGSCTGPSPLCDAGEDCSCCTCPGQPTIPIPTPTPGGTIDCDTGTTGVVLNSASGVSCNQACSQCGFSTCTSIGIDSSASNGDYFDVTQFTGGHSCSDTPGSCSTVMQDLGISCGGLASSTAQWTHCSCSGGVVTPTPAIIAPAIVGQTWNDDFSQQLGGATVRLLSSGSLLSQTTSNSSGTFVFDELEFGTYDLEACGTFGESEYYGNVTGISVTEEEIYQTSIIMSSGSCPF